MAVARLELTPTEIDWVVANLPRPVNIQQRRAMKELKRAQTAVHDSVAREREHTRRLRAGYRTADPDVEALDTGQRWPARKRKS